MPSAWTFTIHPIKELVDSYVGEEKQSGFAGITLILPILINKLADFVTFEGFTCQYGGALSSHARHMCSRVFRGKLNHGCTWGDGVCV